MQNAAIFVLLSLILASVFAKDSASGAGKFEICWTERDTNERACAAGLECKFGEFGERHKIKQCWEKAERDTLPAVEKNGICWKTGDRFERKCGHGLNCRFGKNPKQVPEKRCVAADEITQRPENLLGLYEICWMSGDRFGKACEKGLICRFAHNDVTKLEKQCFVDEKISQKFSNTQKKSLKAGEVCGRKGEGRACSDGLDCQLTGFETLRVCVKPPITNGVLFVLLSKGQICWRIGNVAEEQCELGLICDFDGNNPSTRICVTSQQLPKSTLNKFDSCFRDSQCKPGLECRNKGNGKVDEGMQCLPMGFKRFERHVWSVKRAPKGGVPRKKHKHKHHEHQHHKHKHHKHQHHKHKHHKHKHHKHKHDRKKHSQKKKSPWSLRRHPEGGSINDGHMSGIQLKMKRKKKHHF